MIPQNMALWEFIKILYIAYENAHYSTLHSTPHNTLSITDSWERGSSFMETIWSGFFFSNLAFMEVK